MASTKAQIAKDKGNNAFKAGNWAEAIGYYSEAVIADRTNPTFPLNRAAAYLKLSKFQDAERDCTIVLSLDPKNVKAFFRRAQARSALGRYVEAERDLLDALKLEPANESIKSELSSIRNQDKKSKSKQVPASLPPSVPQPSTAKRRVRNVPIEIVEPEEETPTNGAPTSDKAQPISPSPPADFLTQVQSRPLSSSQDTPARSTSTSASTSAPPSALPSSSSQIPSPQPPPPRTTTSPKPTPRVGAGLFRADGKFTILRSPDAPAPPTSASTSTSTSISAPTSSQDIPQTHFAFARRWNSLKTPQERLNLIQLIPSESLPTLFKNNLAPELLMSILQTFLDTSSISPDHNALILSYMSNIPNIPRFDTVVLLFSAKERDVIKSLWDNIDPDGTSEYRVSWGVVSA